MSTSCGEDLPVDTARVVVARLHRRADVRVDPKRPQRVVQIKGDQFREGQVVREGGGRRGGVFQGLGVGSFCAHHIHRVYLVCLSCLLGGFVGLCSVVAKWGMKLNRIGYLYRSPVTWTPPTRISNPLRSMSGITTSFNPFLSNSAMDN